MDHFPVSHCLHRRSEQRRLRLGQSCSKVGGGTINVSLAPDLPVKREAVQDWIQRATTAITAFYGRYPVKSVAIDVGSADSGEVQGGREFDGDNRNSSWERYHAHLAGRRLDDHARNVSSLPAEFGRPVFMDERRDGGLSRAGGGAGPVGRFTPEHFWKDLVEGMPHRCRATAIAASITRTPGPARIGADVCTGYWRMSSSPADAQRKIRP